MGRNLPSLSARLRLVDKSARGKAVMMQSYDLQTSRWRRGWQVSVGSRALEPESPRSGNTMLMIDLGISRVVIGQSPLMNRYVDQNLVISLDLTGQVFAYEYDTGKVRHDLENIGHLVELS